MSQVKPYHNILEYGQKAVNHGKKTLNYDKLFAQAGKTSTGAVPKLKIADKLLIIDGSFEKLVVKFYTKFAKDKKFKMIKIYSWEQLSKKLQEYDKIDQLVIVSHGAKNGLKINKEPLSFEDAKKKYFKNKKLPIIRKLHFEGCHIGEGGKQLISFANLFDAPRTSAYTFVHVWNRYRLKVPAKTELDKIIDKFNKDKKFTKYFVYPKIANIRQEAKKMADKDKSKEYKYLMEYWNPKDSGISVHGENSKIRSDASQVIIKNVDDLEKIDSDKFQLIVITEEVIMYPKLME